LASSGKRPVLSMTMAALASARGIIAKAVDALR
jgi:hypothetical protein